MTLRTKYDYLNMQLGWYNNEAAKWSLDNKEPVVGNYHLHEASPLYDTILFKGFDTKGKVALEYGCGPGRNLVRFAPRFDRVDGVDISPVNIEKAKLHLQHAGIPLPNLYVNHGNDIPVIQNTYDVVFSVICLQHICVHSIRMDIMREIFEVLKPGGYFCAQMNLGYRPPPTSPYYEDTTDATTTNGFHDCMIENEQYLIDDLTSIGFIEYQRDLTRGIGDPDGQWIWFQVRKPDATS